jgi:hypothetical protein
MLCPRCKVELLPGIAIDPGSKGIARRIMDCHYIADAKTIEIIDVLKCPKCGYSDDGVA